MERGGLIRLVGFGSKPGIAVSLTLHRVEGDPNSVEDPLQRVEKRIASRLESLATR